MAASDTRVLTAHVPSVLAEAVDALAERLERPRGWVVKEALTAFIAVEARRQQLTLEGLGDVEFDRTVDHAEVEAWAMSLSSKKPKTSPKCK